MRLTDQSAAAGMHRRWLCVCGVNNRCLIMRMRITIADTEEGDLLGVEAQLPPVGIQHKAQ